VAGYSGALSSHHQERFVTLQLSPLDAWHRERGARMVPFAGYDMPVQYPSGIIKEHLHTRAAAGLFDVSHMGQLVIEGPDTDAFLETLLPVDIKGLGLGRQVYALLTNDRGGVRDDLMVTRWGPQQFFLVVNAACKEVDVAYLRERLSGQTLQVLTDQALLALQGPAARELMSELAPEAAGLTFMQACKTQIAGVDAGITCSGYTGEDGFEISIPAAAAVEVASLITRSERVQPIGLGARDSLRLESGLCLYGHELSADIDPIQAGLYWSISRARRPEGERPGGFPGADIIFRNKAEGGALRRVGLAVAGKRPVREGQVVLNREGREVGTVCSAAFGASFGGPIAMAYVEPDVAEPGTDLAVNVRGKPLSVTVTKMPFVAQRYFRG